MSAREDVEGGSERKRHAVRIFVFPTLVAGLALAGAVAGAALATRAGAATSGANALVEAFAGRSGTLLGGAWSFIPLGFAFGAGMVSAVNPCGFVMLPAYLGLYLGAGGGEGRGGPLQLVRALVVGATVSGGFVVLFGAAGLAIGAGARSLATALPWAGLTVGVLLVLSGAWLLQGGKLYSGLAARAASRLGKPGAVGPRGYFVFGVSYGVASLSCTLPVFLAVVGSAFATSGLLAATGQFILYALGMGSVILALTLSIALFRGAMLRTVRKALPHVQSLSAWLMMAAGSYIVFYWLSIGGLLAGKA